MTWCSQESPSPPRPGGWFLLFCSVGGTPSLQHPETLQTCSPRTKAGALQLE